MDRLPQELLCLICEDHLDFAALKEARFVDRRWQAASTPVVFNHFYMGLFSASLTKLEALSNSPLARHVKALTIFSDILPDWSRKAWHAAIDFRPKFREWLNSLPVDEREAISRDKDDREKRKPYHKSPAHSFSQTQLDEGWAAYRAAVQDQKNWRRHGKDLLFREYLARLPALNDAQVKCTQPFVGSTNLLPFWRALRRKILVGPDDWMYRTDSVNEDEYSFLSGQAALSLIEGVAFRACFSGTTPVTKLSVHSAHINSYQTLMTDAWPVIPKGQSPLLHMQRYYTLSEAFANLTELNLHVPHATVSATFYGRWVANETSDFLRSAKRLRKLNLRYGDDELSPDDDATHLERLLEDVSWPELGHLQLAVNLSAEKLVGFLRRHATTLRTLHMRDMLVHNVDYAIEQLPKILELEDIYLECLWDDADRVGETSVNYLCTLSRGTNFEAPYERSVKRYLFGETDIMPKIQRDGGSGDIDHWTSMSAISWHSSTDDSTSEHDEAMSDDDSSSSSEEDGGMSHGDTFSSSEGDGDISSNDEDSVQSEEDYDD